MKRLTMAALVAALALAAVAAHAAAARITVEGLAGDELPNIEAQGRVIFETPGFAIAIRITCDKTIRGRLNRTAEGTLALAGNEAGFINEVRLANCQGGTADARLIDLTRLARLSWIKVVERTEAELASLDTRIKLEVPALGGFCLYLALVVIASRAEAGGRFRALTLRLHNVLAITKSEPLVICPNERQVEMTGSATVTRPAAGIGLRIA